jgi:crotonobetainyl-CoA:carnitine CoA-transferase CaiB-like acyl-CoA transferase
MNSDWAGPLDGIRVIDLTRVLAGPFASQILGDLGADVIKIEPPSGDETRGFAPHRDGESHYFLSVNRSKRGMVLDLRTADGVEILKRLVESADVLIENYRPGVMDRLGIGYRVLNEINPRLIYCAISGFGLSGPLRDQPSFDIVTQALSGAMSVNGEAGGRPVKLGLPLGDLVGGVFGPIGILAMLQERARTGLGRLVDVSLHDGLLGMLGYLAQLSFFTGGDPSPVGSGHLNLVPYGAFPTRDGQIVIACLTDSFWRNLCGALGKEEWITDQRFSSSAARREHREILDDLLSQFTCLRDTSQMQAILSEHDVPSAPILGAGAALNHPHSRARDMVVEVEHQTLGRIPMVGRPIKFSGALQGTPAAPPALGQHTVEVLREILLMPPEEIERLRVANVIG